MAALKRFGKGIWNVMRSPWFRRFLVESVLLPLLVKQTSKISDKELRMLQRSVGKKKKPTKGSSGFMGY